MQRLQMTHKQARKLQSEGKFPKKMTIGNVTYYPSLKTNAQRLKDLQDAVARCPVVAYLGIYKL